MNGTAFALAAAALAAAAAAGGCGFGPGDASPGRAELRVTREFGTIPMVTATLDDPTESDTVVRMLDSSADLETSYGGNFVDSIDGYAGSTAGGGDEDWFFFVNGYYSDIGSGETPVRPGDRIWWDYRYWSAAYRVPAVVGSWPEPFLHGYEGDRPATVVQCLTDRAPCDAVMASLEDEGVDAALERPAAPEPSPDELRILVGPWDAVREDPAARADRGGTGGERRLRELRALCGGDDADRRRRSRPRGRAARRCRDDRGGPPRPRPADVGRHRHRRDRGRRRGGGARRRRAPRSLRGRLQRWRAGAPALVGGRPRRGPRGLPMSPMLAYAPRRGPLGAARPWIAAVYLAPLAIIAFTFANPLVLLAAGSAAAGAGIAAGAGRSIAQPLRWSLGLAVMVVGVNAIASQRGDTVLFRGFELPVVGRIDVTLEALAEGGVLALRILVALLVFAVWSACVDPDRVLRAIRPFAARSALTATLVSRLVPTAAADGARMAEAGRLRGPAAAPVGRAVLARRLVAGSLDRSVDIAATLELRGYGLGIRSRLPRHRREPGEGGLLRGRRRRARRDRARRSFRRRLLRRLSAGRDRPRPGDLVVRPRRAGARARAAPSRRPP